MDRVLSEIRRREIAGISLLRLPIIGLDIVARVGLAAACVYICSVAAGALDGFGLPTTAIFRWIEAIRIIGLYDYHISRFVILLCCLAAIASWISAGKCAEAIEMDEKRLALFIRRWGLVILGALFVFTISGSWAGLARSGDFNSASIGGLLPFSDANGYFAGAHDQTKDGYWNSISMRRPFAAAFRSVLMIWGGYSYSTMLLLQALLASTAAWIAACSIVRWRGPVAGFAFAAVSFMIYRPFLATTLTEPLGLIWAFLSTACFVESLRCRSRAFGILGLLLAALALMTRMGAMFLVPALALWLLMNFSKGWKEKFILGVAIAGVIAGVYFTNSMLQKTFGSGGDLSGSNFSYVICGLSIGENWSSCVARYPLARTDGDDERKYTDFIYARAVENIRNDPLVLVRRLVSGGVEFVMSVPPTIVGGNLRAAGSRWIAALLVLTALCGLVLSFWQRSEKRLEISFWILSMSSIVASSMFVYFDDGMRVMVASYPLIAALLVSGLANPFQANVAPQPFQRRLFWGCSASIALAMTSLFVVPLVANRLAPEPVTVAGNIDEHQVFGGRRLSGFLVMADAQPLAKNVAAIHYSDFAKIVALSNVEIYQGLIHPQSPQLPFGLVAAPRRERGTESRELYIVPPHVLLQTDASAWTFLTADWQLIQGNSVYWKYVTKAVAADR